MALNQEIIEKVKQTADIVSMINRYGVHLKQAGSNFKGLCPFHQEKTPSFVVNPQRGFFHCFGCGKSGSAIDFVMEYEKLSFAEAATELANQLGIPLEKIKGIPQSEDKILQALDAAAKFYQSYLQQQAAAPGQKYLQARAVPQDIQNAFQIGFIPDEWQLLIEHLTAKGFSPNELAHAGMIKISTKSGRPYDTFRNRIIFPIRDTRGRCIAFGGRSIDPKDQPKYINSPETKYYQKKRTLYGFYEGLATIKQVRQLILVEGYLDVTRLHEFGFQQAVATCGTSLTIEHIRFAKRYVDKIILILDGDNAGQQAALRSCPLFLSTGMDASVVTLPAGEDPDSLLITQGPKKFSELLQRDTPVFEYLVKQSLAKHNPNVQGRTKAVEELLPMIRDIQEPQKQQLALMQLAESINLPVPAILEIAPKSLHYTQNNAILQNLHPTVIVNNTEDQDEKWVLQALLTSRDSIRVAREHLHANEFRTPHFRHIYEIFLIFSNEDFESMPIEALEQKFPEVYPKIMGIYMDDFVLEGTEIELLLQRSIVRVKKRNLDRSLQEKLAASETDEDKLQASKEIRTQRQILDQLFKNVNLNSNKIEEVDL
ncbi:MAG: DNA primase [SAR324 cluster bacterium]|nr:DNA primase [SAR324 cluster bacterium]